MFIQAQVQRVRSIVHTTKDHLLPYAELLNQPHCTQKAHESSIVMVDAFLGETVVCFVNVLCQNY